MKKFRIPTVILTIALLASLLAPAARALDDPAVDCQACVLLSLDGDSETVLYQKNEQQKVYPASLTKIMTVLLAVEAVEAGTVGLTDSVTVQEGFDADQVEDGSTVFLGLGEILSLKDLLYCAMVASANEACNVIAQYISGSVSAFVDLMNQRAAELGCINTHFVNPHGLQDPEHYTTAWDFSLIAREAVSHDLFMEICNTPTYTVPATNLTAERTLSSTNALINPGNTTYPGDYGYEYAKGVKTGHTSDAGYCLVSTAEKDNIRLLSVVMNAQANQLEDGSWYYGQFGDTITLFDWALNNFSYQEIVKSTEIVADVPVAMGADTDSVAARPSTSITALLPNDTDLTAFTRTVTITSETSGQTLEAPVTAGQTLGEISVSKDGVVYGTSALVASTAVDLSRTQYMKSQIQETLKKPAVILTFWALVLLFGLYIALVVRYRAKRRAYQKRLLDARQVRLDLEDDEDGAEDSPYDGRPQAPAPRTRARRPVLTHAAGRTASPEEPEETPEETPDGTEPTEESAAPEEPAPKPVDEPTKMKRALSDEDEQNFRDYFEEFFGKK